MLFFLNLFLFFGSLILNEIIVFNCWRLNEFTISKTSERAQSDVFDFPPLEPNNSEDPSCEEIED